MDTKFGPNRRPRGRPLGAQNKIHIDIKELCRSHAPKIIAELLRIASEGKTETVKIMAAKEILDRGFGRPAQSVEMTGKDGQPLMRQALDNMPLSDEERARLRSILTPQPPEPAAPAAPEPVLDPLPMLPPPAPEPERPTVN